MGGSTYSHDDYAARASVRAATGTPVFKHSAAVASGTATGVHPSLNPYGVGIRESRDSDAHPVTVPIAVIMDTTGSMAEVPKILEEALSKLMGTFLDDKASGKKYLGDGYPAILIGAIDDYQAQVGYRSTDPNNSGALQMGQFESGIEIDNDLENLWLTKNGGGTYDESYELALYFLARRTAHDAWDKRGRKGYVFLIGDEHAYKKVSREQVKNVIGDTIQADINTKDIIAEVQERYHLFFVIPNLTNHYGDPKLFDDWVNLLGQNVLRLEDPSKICELIAATVAINEENVGLDDLTTDLGDAGAAVGTALAVVAQGKTVGLSRVSADALPVPAGDAPDVEMV